MRVAFGPADSLLLAARLFVAGDLLPRTELRLDGQRLVIGQFEVRHVRGMQLGGRFLGLRPEQRHALQSYVAARRRAAARQPQAVLHSA
jgi:hypothetical protein